MFRWFVYTWSPATRYLPDFDGGGVLPDFVNVKSATRPFLTVSISMVEATRSYEYPNVLGFPCQPV